MASYTYLDVVSAMKYVTITVTVKRKSELMVRAWIAIRLIKLAAWILNCKIVIEEEYV